MLRKLLKYEMKAGIRLLPIAYLALAGVFLLGLLARALDIAQIQVTASILLAVGAVGTVVWTLIFIILQFYKGLFGAEGYLMQTLPVSKGKLILSKLIAAYLWIVAGAAAALLAVVGVFYLNGLSAADLIQAVFGEGARPLAVYLVIISAVQLLAFIGELYFAVTLANTRVFLRNNVVFSVLFFFAANFAVSLLEVVGMLIIPLGIKISGGAVQWTTETMLGSLTTGISSGSALVNGVVIGLGSGFVDLAAGIALLLVARWLLEKKTSVK